MQDFTLVIPTYNRPRELGALLTYLGRLGVEFRILVLDSSRPDEREANQRRIEATKLRVKHAEYPIETHPFDKFRDGIDRVETPFCAMCADDDLIVPEGSARCVAALRADSSVAVAQGYSFMFGEHAGERFDLVNVLYFKSTIAEDDPLARLLSLFETYQATTYGHYRTEVLRGVFHGVRPIRSILGRELLSSALATVAGKVVRLDCFSNGRSIGASAAYEHWHPLEWMAKDPQQLLQEYSEYRRILTDAVALKIADCGGALRPRDDIERCIDLVHLLYLVKHAPVPALRFIIEQQLAGVDFGAYWPRYEIQIPLIDASGVGRPRQDLPARLARHLWRLVAKTGVSTGGMRADLRITHGRRNYFVHSPFACFVSDTFGPRARAITDNLLIKVDNYTLETH